MSTRLDMHFDPYFTLGHRVGGSGVFDGATEIGRARGTVGSGDAATRLAAKTLGDWANGVVYDVRAPAGAGRVELDPLAATRRVVFVPPAGATAVDAADIFPERHRAAGRTRPTAANADFEFFMTHEGTGGDPIDTGTHTLAGGLEPIRANGTPYFQVEDVNAGFFCFDCVEPLVLVQVTFELSSSVAWSLGICRRMRDGMAEGTAIPVASATSQRGAVFDKPVVILPHYGVAFAASAQGSVYVTVGRLRR